MIAYIAGRLIEKFPTHVILEAGGIGYHVHISLHTYAGLHPEPSGFIRLFTHLHIKEDAHTLYGFSDQAERRLFIHLISVAGIGPSSGRMILSSVPPSELENAIVQGEVALIQRIKGIGPKTAQRLILELQDKLKKESSGLSNSLRSNNTVRDEALEALITLGFVKAGAEKALDKAFSTASAESLTVDVIIKLALKNL